jgi:plasmid stabilization system protein ParE
VRIEILPEARDDLLAGFRFYERQAPGLGKYFRDSLNGDIASLEIYGGIHAKVFGYHRSLSKRFPFAIYYRVEENVVRVRAILDCRRHPSWIRRKLSAGHPKQP